MAANNSKVEIAWMNHPTRGGILVLNASDPDGIQLIEVFSKHRRVPRKLHFRCETHVETSLDNYPSGWFPVTVRIVDCDRNGINIDEHGPYGQDGDKDPIENPPDLPAVDPEDIEKPKPEEGFEAGEGEDSEGFDLPEEDGDATPGSGQGSGTVPPESIPTKAEIERLMLELMRKLILGPLLTKR